MNKTASRDGSAPIVVSPLEFMQRLPRRCRVFGRTFD